MSWKPDDLTLLIDAARLLGPVGPEDPETAKPRRALDQGGASTKPAHLQAWLHAGQTAFFVVCGRQADCWDIEVEHLDDVRYIVEGFRGPVARSARGGVHLWTLPVKEGNRRLVRDGVHIGELKGRNGTVTVPPSVRPKGRYTWLRGPWQAPLPRAHASLLALIPPAPQGKPTQRTTSGAAGAAALEGLAQTVARAQRGNRNSVLFWAVCRALEPGLPVETVSRVLTRAASDAGLPEDEIARTINSGVRHVSGG